MNEAQTAIIYTKGPGTQAEENPVWVIYGKSSWFTGFTETGQTDPVKCDLRVILFGTE